MSLREIYLVLDSAARRDAHLAWVAAQYVAVAVHNPKDMPPDPGKAPNAAGPISSDVTEEIRAIRRRVKLAYDTEKARKHNGR